MAEILPHHILMYIFNPIFTFFYYWYPNKRVYSWKWGTTARVRDIDCYSIQSNLPMQSPLLSSHLYYIIGHLFVVVSCHRIFHMNWTSFKRSPLLKGHFFLVPKVTGLYRFDCILNSKTICILSFQEQHLSKIFNDFIITYPRRKWSLLLLTPEGSEDSIQYCSRVIK